MKRKNLTLVFILLSYLFFASSAWAWPPSWQKMPIEKNEYFIETDTEIGIYTVEKKLRRTIPMKDRKAVLLIHGSGVGYAYWDLECEGYSMMDFLSRLGFYVYAVDQRGFGMSSRPDGLSVTAEASANDLKSVIDFIKKRTHVKKVDIVGHSWGAVVCMYLAEAWPEDIGKIVLMGATYETVHPQFQPVVNFLIQLAKGGASYIPNQHHLTVENSLYSYDEDVIDCYKTLVGEMYPFMPTGPFLDLDTYDYTSFVPDIVHPTFLINGVHEYVVDRDDSFQLLEDLRAEKKDLLTIGNAYHLIVLEEIAHTRLYWATASWLLQQ
jgi:pimeloyl-ACP methyl ester carboxylesterase